jgi:hypothetical protein
MLNMSPLVGCGAEDKGKGDVGWCGSFEESGTRHKYLLNFEANCKTRFLTLPSEDFLLGLSGRIRAIREGVSSSVRLCPPL